MISRINKLKIFNITKQHNIPYYNHSYYKKNIYIKKLTNYNFSKEEWNEVSIRNSLFKWYFLNNLESTEENCKLYFKQYLKDIFIVSDSINNEIKKSKNSAIYTNRCFSSIISKIINLKDNNNEDITYTIKYEHYNKIKKEKETLNMFLIMTKSMINEIKNNNIYQFFGDATYRCIPPTFKGYRLYIISGYNLLIKRTRILAFILIPNETEQTYEECFQN